MWKSQTPQRQFELAQVRKTLFSDRSVDALEHVAIAITNTISVRCCFTHGGYVALLMKTINGDFHVHQFSTEHGVSKMLATELTIPK